MTGPPNQGQPWWARPGGAPIPGGPPQYPPPPWQPVAPHYPAQAPPPPKKSRAALWVAAFLLVGAIAAVAVLLASGVFDKNVLDVGRAEAGVRQILTDPINGYGANDVTSVKCNNGKNPTVKKGGSFTCQVTLNGVDRKVNVVFRDDAGNYDVDGPR
jgi:hypothetical protein